MKKNVLFLLAAMFAVYPSFSQCDLQRGPVVINEFLASNETIAQNAIGQFEDYVELYNTDDAPFNLNGYFLSDSRGNIGRTKYRFDNVVIPANGYLIVWCDGLGDPEMDGLNANFGLSGSLGELVALSNPDSVIVDYVRFGPVESDVSIGRFPNGTGPFMQMVPTFNGANTNGDSFNVTINEYMATNSNTATDEFGDHDDWVELYNNGVTSVDLTGYLLSDNEDIPGKFTFPSGSVIGPGEYFIVWADNEPIQGPYHADFALSATGEKVILSSPDTTTIDFFAFGEQITDISEGRFPNGFGNLIPCMAPTFAAENLGTVSSRNTEVTNHAIEVYPNPATTGFVIENPFGKNEVMRLFDLNGRMVRETLLHPYTNSVDVSDLNAGIYVIQTSFGRAKLAVTD